MMGGEGGGDTIGDGEGGLGGDGGTPPGGNSGGGCGLGGGGLGGGGDGGSTGGDTTTPLTLATLVRLLTTADWRAPCDAPLLLELVAPL